jgi:HAD superfamily hydrolase (TIGR01509 family)
VIQALIFDFDGLIIDTEAPVYQAWAEIYREHDLELDIAFWQTVVGHGPGYFDPIADLERRLRRELDADAIQARRRRRELELVSELQVLPGVRAWHRQAAALGVRQGIASSSSRAWVVGHLERLGLDGWDCIRCRDDVSRTKPAPDLYLAALSCLGVVAAAAVAVEDSGVGVAAAKAAGLRCVAVPCPLTAGHDFGSADLVLGSLAEMSFPEAVARLEGQASQKASS